MSNTERPRIELGLASGDHACACANHSNTEHGQSDSAVGGDGALSQDSAIDDPTETREQYLVEGMTCEHCVASVTEEVSALDGVQSVSVDLRVGGASRVTVVGDHTVTADQVRDAVVEAGYVVVAAER